MIRKNDEIELTIENMTSEGSGVAHADGLAVFVPGAAIGDRALCHIIKVKKNYAVAKLTRVLEPGADRVDSDCPYFPRCGGCAYRHIRPEAELRIKRDRVREDIRRIGHLELEVRPTLDAGRLRYRNKAEYPVRRDEKGLHIGFYAAKSHRVIDCEDCLLQPSVFADIVRVFRGWLEAYGISVYDETTGRGLVRHLYLRRAEATEQIMATVVATRDTLPREAELVAALTRAFPEIKSVYLNVNGADTNVILGSACRLLWGQETITDTLCGRRIALGPLSFYQVNRAGAELLYGEAMRAAALTGKETLLDLYCGAGTIGLSMSDHADRLIGAEIVPQAVENARENALANGVTNAEFLCMDAAEAARTLAGRGLKPDVIVVDPPRKGLSPDLPAIIAGMAPDRVVYVSCDSATLARDLERLNALGYVPQYAQPVDMFPGTAHVETVCLMSRDEGK